MRGLIFIFTILLGPYSADARKTGFDAKLGLGARSTPAGLALIGESGFGIPLWGDWREQTSFVYGYMRPYVQAATSPSVNTLDAAVSFHPISFFHLTVGRGVSSRWTTNSGIVDCWSVECGGILRSEFGASSLALAHGEAFLANDLEWRDVRPARDMTDFYEDGYALIGARGFDRFFTQSTSAGWRPASSSRLPNGFFFGLNFKRTETHRAASYGERLVFVSGGRQGEWLFTYSIGAYRSSQQAAGPTIGLLIQWRPRPGLAID